MELSPVEQRLARIEEKIDAVCRSSEKLRRYFLVALMVTVAVVVVPLLILPFVIPSFLQTLSTPGGF